ncbi:MAG: hypothetical protein WB992_03425 [Bryobacteraceae bacterium]
MKRSAAYACQYCGSASLRRSRRQSAVELSKMALGIYPFRCLDCNQRVWVNIWLFSKLAYAKCPKCLGMQLTTWPARHYHLTLWNKLLMTFGANRYRCSVCRENFLSFRAREGRDNTAKEGGQSEAAAEETGALSETETET